jgi:hypothetical protein
MINPYELEKLSEWKREKIKKRSDHSWWFHQTKSGTTEKKAPDQQSVHPDLSL